MHMGDYNKTYGNASGRYLYYTLRRGYCGPSMEVYCYATVRSCTEYARERSKLRKNLTHRNLFPYTEPLAFVAIHIMG